MALLYTEKKLFFKTELPSWYTAQPAGNPVSSVMAFAHLQTCLNVEWLTLSL